MSVCSDRLCPSRFGSVGIQTPLGTPDHFSSTGNRCLLPDLLRI
ncbi:hypothetical protein SynMEDNS5_01778 [Synechococcus sp. MEDNS5]|nr:hypothetical protein SynMEDNS5_01778 [Synechococcus sp. MEDNS5]